MLGGLLASVNARGPASETSADHLDRGPAGLYTNSPDGYYCRARASPIHAFHRCRHRPLPQPRTFDGACSLRPSSGRRGDCRHRGMRAHIARRDHAGPAGLVGRRRRQGMRRAAQARQFASPTGVAAHTRARPRTGASGRGIDRTGRVGVLHCSQIFHKAPAGGGTKPAHQDNFYSKRTR